MISGAGRRNALRTAQCARRLSTTAANAAKSPHRVAIKATAASEVTKRPASTGAAASPAPRERAVPSPAFNRDDGRRNDIHALRSKEVKLDHSFVGMTGGEIFHEMMLRHDVKHICKHIVFNPQSTKLMVHSWISWRCYPTCFRCHSQLAAFRFHSSSA